MQKDPIHLARRARLSSIVFGFLVLVSAASGGERPNVVLFLADDMTWRDCGAYGNAEVATPNIDRLAAEGMRFTRAYTATAMCAPTRQQLYTGLFPVRNGAYPNHSRVRVGTRSIAHHLSDLGYRVGLAGKRHFKPASSFPFEYFQELRGEAAADGPLDLAALGEFVRRDAEQPFCLVVCSHDPHAPWDQGDASAYDPKALTIPPYLVDTPKTRDALARYYAEITSLDRDLGRVLDLVEEAGRTDDTLFLFTSEQGAQFPRAKWTCYELGLRTAFVARWPSRVEAGSVTDAMVQYVDVAPTLVELAGGDPSGVDSGRPRAADGGRGFDGVSFAPVLLGRADRHAELVFGVHTTRGITDGSESYPVRSIHDGKHKLILNLDHEATFTNIVTERDESGVWREWKAAAEGGDRHARRLVETYQHRPAVELYDLAADPFELVNLADEPSSEAIVERLRVALEAWMARQGDWGVGTERLATERR